MTVESQARRVARLKRTEMLDAAVAEMTERGWRGLQMQAVADRVGVSRQTVYYTFKNRDGLAAAMVEHLTDSFLDGFDTAFAQGEAPNERWAEGVRYLLERGRDDPALRAMLGFDSGDGFLELLTSRSAPIIARARERIPATALHYEANLNRTRLTQVAELLARLVLSEVVQPMIEPEIAMLTVTEMVSRFMLADPAGWPAEQGRSGAA